MAEVFVSYKREDRARVALIADILVELGLTVWFDTSLISGEDWAARIDAEIAACSAMVVCWSSAATQSTEVLREVRQGGARAILAPVLIEPCQIPHAFQSINAADLSQWSYKLDSEPWLSLLSRLGDLTGRADLGTVSRERAAGQEASAVLRDILIDAARAELLLTYGEASAALRRELNQRFHGHAPNVTEQFLYGALDATAHENRMKREPPLCVLVVAQRSGLPGRGYFQKHCFLDGDNDAIARAVFARHVERVRAWPWEFRAP